jgi:hypothetical protein
LGCWAATPVTRKIEKANATIPENAQSGETFPRPPTGFNSLVPGPLGAFAPLFSAIRICAVSSLLQEFDDSKLVPQSSQEKCSLILNLDGCSWKRNIAWE